MGYTIHVHITLKHTLCVKQYTIGVLLKVGLTFQDVDRLSKFVYPRYRPMFVSVASWCSMETDARIELVFDMRLLSTYFVPCFNEIWNYGHLQNKDTCL